MKIKLDPETGDRLEQTEWESAPASPRRGRKPGYRPSVSATALESRTPQAPKERVTAESRLGAVIEAALNGTLIRPRPLRDYEPEILTPLHINMIYDRAAGMKPVEIAAKYDMNSIYVGRILHHPDAECVMRALLSVSADRMTDPIERLQAYSHEMIDVKIELVRNTEDESLKDRIASDILDRAGLGRRQQVSVESTHRFMIGSQAAAQLAQGLKEAAEAEAADFTIYNERPSAGALPQESEAPAGLPDGAGHSPVVDASLDASSGVDAELEQALAEERSTQPQRRSA